MVPAINKPAIKNLNIGSVSTISRLEKEAICLKKSKKSAVIMATNRTPVNLLFLFTIAPISKSAFLAGTAMHIYENQD